MAILSFETRTKLNGETALTKTVEVEASAGLSIDESIGASQTDLEIACSIDQSELVGLSLLSSVDMTIETNDGSSPDDTIALKANEPLDWHATSIHACPLSADVTSIFVTNTTAGTLKIRAVMDATP